MIAYNELVDYEVLDEIARQEVVPEYEIVVNQDGSDDRMAA